MSAPSLHLLVVCWAAMAAAQVSVEENRAVIRAGVLERVVEYGPGKLDTVSLKVAGKPLLVRPASEFRFAISKADPDQRPAGLTAAEAGESIYFTSSPQTFWQPETYEVVRWKDNRALATRWVEPRPATSQQVGAAAADVSRPKPGITRLVVRCQFAGELKGLSVELFYEAYESRPVIRKWLRIVNGTRHWRKIEDLVIDDPNLAAEYLTRTPLTPSDNGSPSAIVAFSNRDRSAGVIAASEIPSALRLIEAGGAMRYNRHFFEWILGPDEEFVSEPVFHYAFSGAAEKTVSAVSTPLDRTLEGPWIEFLHRHIGIEAERTPFYAPQWLTWAYFFHRIDDALVRRMTDIAARAGFAQVLLDDGWQKGRLGTVPDETTFPDFAATTAYVRSKVPSLGLWLSSFRDADSPDLAAHPDARILPLVHRSKALLGYAMSYTSRWREYYVRDLVEVAKRYGATYFKQDFSNIIYGDFAEGHENRSRKESLLRGLRRLLEVQAELRRQAPDVVNELTHEIYWGTPGVPADLAALKVTARFHIPPNECRGSEPVREHGGKEPTAEEHRADLRKGCWESRKLFYSYRGLPLYPLEYYAAATTNWRGSLTPEIQDRQVVSWLLGAPVSFSGDLGTLTEANISHYRRRFDELARLDKAYGIYRRFQFSGVPEPTDADWHWWGKLDAQGHGAVVVVRGSGGAKARMVNIPWVGAEASYRVRGLFSGEDYGTVAGRTLERRGIKVALPVFGQDLLELAP